ncbi:MAG: hypothetical protein EOL88_02070 [Bacteroidia bacterium]|nr:hypothetical protein [Bacteroidia bacterium]
MMTIILALSILGVVSFYLQRRRRASWLSMVICGIILYGCFVVLIFGNGPIIRIYKRLLKHWNIGWRQASTLAREAELYEKDLPQYDFLAVGSSQTYALYTEFARKHEEVSVFNIAGMNILDIILYENAIERLSGGHILLMLSDFDLCRQPAVTGLRIAPRQPITTLMVLVPQLYKSGLMSFSELQDYVLAQLFPGYRYQYVSRGLIDKILRKNMAFPSTGAHDIGKADANDVMRKALRGLHVRYLKANLELVRNFLTWATSCGFKVSIIEGGV